MTYDIIACYITHDLRLANNTYHITDIKSLSQKDHRNQIDTKRFELLLKSSAGMLHRKSFKISTDCSNSGIYATR